MALFSGRAGGSAKAHLLGASMEGGLLLGGIRRNDVMGRTKRNLVHRQFYGGVVVVFSLMACAEERSPVVVVNNTRSNITLIDATSNTLIAEIPSQRTWTSEVFVGTMDGAFGDHNYYLSRPSGETVSLPGWIIRHLGRFEVNTVGALGYPANEQNAEHLKRNRTNVPVVIPWGASDDEIGRIWDAAHPHKQMPQLKKLRAE